jgi:transcriptional regulator with XRE-family HTH domain
MAGAAAVSEDARVPRAKPADAAYLRRVGARLRELRTERGLTQDAVAERAGLVPHYISYIEAGKNNLPLCTLRALVEDGIGATLGELFEARAPARAARKPRARPAPAKGRPRRLR